MPPRATIALCRLDQNRRSQRYLAYWKRVMFEIGIFCVIFLAVAYWAVLWLMGRREDVLHGEFVKSEPPAKESVRPVFPKRPVRSAPPH